MNLAPIDLVIMAVPFVVILVVSLYMRRFMRSVADFLAAGRCAGRYLICTSIDFTGSSVMGMIGTLEVFSKTGFSLRFWEGFGGIIGFFMGLLGLVVYRFRETRALTFHQFFEMRYSKGLRIFSSFINVFSGMFNFGLQPAIGARFFVYFCGLPETFTVGGVAIQTFIAIMLILMAVSMFFAVTGGQISVMVTDCLEGVLSSFFYLIVAIFIICTLSRGQIFAALDSGSPGKSYINPFDISGQTDFNGWYVVLGMLINIYFYRGNAWSQGFAAAAKTAHEGRMAQILSNWRGFGYGAMTVLISLAAFTVLNHPDFAAQRATVEHGVQNIGNPQMQTEMRMPMALGIFLAPGFKGCLLAVLLFGLLASQGMQLHSYGSTILQDIVMPFRKKAFQPKTHILALRLSVFGVAIFVCTFSALYKPVEYLVMLTTLIGTIYLGGIGCVVWGGLYWKRGTTAGAWVAISMGAFLGIAFNVMQQMWTTLDPWLVSWCGAATPMGHYFAAHPDRSPINGLQLSVFTAACAGLSYVVVSLLTCRQPFNLDEMLHRGAYRIKNDEVIAERHAGKRSVLARLIDIDEHFTLGDKVITIGTLVWSMTWKVVALGILFYSLFLGHLTTHWWFSYIMITGVWMTLGIGILTTVGFTLGVAKDLKDLFRTLRTARRLDADDGMVQGHHNVGDPVAPLREKGVP